MRNAFLAALIAVAVSTISVARGAPGHSPVRPLVVSSLPTRCRALTVVPPSARISAPELAAHVSVASCMAEEAMSGLALWPDAASIAALDAAAAPSLAMLDDVIEYGDARWMLVAEEAKADLLFGMIVRMRVVTDDPGDREALDAMLAPWLNEATQVTRDANGVTRQEQRFEHDRTRYNDARSGVAADVRLLRVANGRVIAFRVAWDRAVGDGHPGQAGELAPLHHGAFLDAVAARTELARAQQDLDSAQRALMADRRQLRVLHPRADTESESSLDL